MKILIVAGTFPPYAPSSASRANKFAKYLEVQGHEIRVLAPKLPGQDMSLSPEISLNKITFTDYYNINDFPTTIKEKIKGIFSSKKVGSPPSAPENENSNTSTDRKESYLSKTYRTLTNIPDGMIGWYPSAIRAGRKMFKDWSPDIIFATAPPYTGLLVANKLAKIIDVPWIADYRDLWNDESNDQYKTFRGRINQLIEKYFLSNCSGLVTVTDSWVQNLTSSYNLPVTLAMNGFDPDDFDEKNKKILYPDHLTILYAGYFYDHKRDPSKLFEALGKLGKKAKDIKILFYTPDGFEDFNDVQKSLIIKYGLQDHIINNKFIPQNELLNIQLGVDILLLLRWNNPRENGVIAGKLFEYIGAGKAILSVGSTTGEAADIICDNKFGTVSNNAEEIAAYLEECLKVRQNDKPINYSIKNRDNFKRSLQFEKIEKMLQDLVDKQGNNP